ncbi:hypothetical protein K8B33_00170 [Alcanivorax sp. JB21]|uniref:outer membrane beta-barrel protein n=1 Tax=Alcanivorax limicola TaxID=2874102 RepID=UPI001CBD8F64|nr:outer membrane beta-barrel protein [Alcanivorax limicola]MBZ2187498.1 hypothetical protein [Alcanivorax limicola]
MNKINGLAAAIALAAVPFAASAQSLISYDYLQLDIIVDGELSESGFSEDVDGFALEGSALLHPNVFIAGQSTQGYFDDSGDDAAFDQFSFGVGGRFGLMESASSALDVYGVLNYENISFLGASFSGFGIGAGLRWAPADQFEINASVSHVDYGKNVGAEIEALRYQLRGLFHATENLSFALDFRFEELDIDFGGGAGGDLDYDQIRLGARWNF